jgi:hypothetical protein
MIASRSRLSPLAPARCGGVPRLRLPCPSNWIRFAGVLAAAALCAAPITAAADGKSSTASANACFAMGKGVYGFSCIGSSSTGGPLEPITLGGVVQGNATGFYEAFGTLNSSSGSAHVHLSGQAAYGTNCEGHADCEAFTVRNCWGHIDYTTNEILLPGGGVIPLPVVSVDFAVVDEGREILGTPVPGTPGATGDFVPRFSCRLVKLRE